MRNENLLEEGIRTLCQNDSNTESLIAPRFGEILNLLERYIKEIELFNSAYGLVSYKNTEELITRHILDSISPLGIILELLENNKPCCIADAGSGAGFPGIPLAVILPETEFTLIERMGRRAGFLFNVKAVLDLSNVTVEETDLEKAGKGRFSIITFRAFRPLEPELVKTLFNACNENGIIAAYKGKREKIENEIRSIDKNLCRWEIIPYRTPFLDEQRHIVIGRRIS